MNVRADQPSCAKCGTALPWEDVDRGFGRCPSCGVSFDFTVPESTSMSLRAAPAAPPPPEIAAQAIPLPTTRIARPGAVRVTDEANGFVLAWSATGPREQLVFGTAAVGLGISLLSLVKGDAIAAGIFFFLAVLAAFAGLRTRNAGGKIAVRAGTISSDEGPEIQAADVTSFRCEDGGSGSGASIVAVTRDPRSVPLASGIEERAVAVYVTQVLIERLLVNSPSRSRT